MSFNNIILKDFCNINPLTTLKKGEVYNFIEMQDICPGYRFVSPLKSKAYKGGSKFLNNDILFARITPCLENGKIAQAEFNNEMPGFGSTEFIIFRYKENISDPNFLFYLTCSDLIRKPAEKSMTGASGRQRANIEFIKNLQINLPDINLQRKIGSVLTEYDLLIKNNNRRIEILEETALIIYSEFFIKNKSDSWEMKSILDIDIFNFCRSRIKKYDGYKEYFDTSSIDGIKIIEKGLMCGYDKRPSRAQIKPINNSVWFARMRETYKVLVFNKLNNDEADNSILSTGMVGFSTEEEYLGFLFFTINSKWFHKLKDQFATGATQVSLTNEGLSKMKLSVPEKDLIVKYSKITNPIVDEIILLLKKNKNLINTRDLLLPKLISGEIGL